MALKRCAFIVHIINLNAIIQMFVRLWFSHVWNTFLCSPRLYSYFVGYIPILMALYFSFTLVLTHRQGQIDLTQKVGCKVAKPFLLSCLLFLNIDKIRETCLGQFGQVQYRPATTPLKRSFSMHVDGPQMGKGRPKRIWIEVVRLDIQKCYPPKDLALDRSEWIS